jgi:O-antigen ligase
VIRRFSSLTNPVVANPIARVLVSLLLLTLSLGGLAAVAYADQYVNGGVAWGNDYPHVDNTDASPLGVNVFLEKEVDPANIDKTLQMVRDAGFKFVRQDFAWNDIEISGKGNFVDTRNPGTPVSSWDKYDRIVDKCQQYGLQIIARLDSPPVWARIPGDDVEKWRKGPPRDYNDYANFVYTVANRYKGKVKYFQIWNEPNLIGEWGGHPVSPEEYTKLLKAGHDAAKRATPDAVILTAALAPTAENSVANQNDVLFLEGMYREGAAQYFDILSTMLYGLGQSPETRRVDLKYLDFSRPILLRRVMEEFGDIHKTIWISEYAWISLPPDFKGDPAKNIWGKSVDEQTQAQWLVEGYQRTIKEWPWMGVMCVWYFREPDPHPEEPANYFAIVRPDFTPRPAYTAIQQFSKQLPLQVDREKPAWNVWGFPLGYGLFGLLALASAALGASGVAKWTQAALDRPRGKYSEAVRETARNGAMVVAMMLLISVYYRANSLPLILASLAAWWLLAFVKPSTGLAFVAFTIPFFWYPKDLGQQHFPLAETLLVLVFAAVLARYAVSYFLPSLASRLRFDNQAALSEETIVQEQGPVGARLIASLHQPERAQSPAAKERVLQTIPLEIEVEDDELMPARWPELPKARTRPAIARLPYVTTPAPRTQPDLRPTAVKERPKPEVVTEPDYPTTNYRLPATDYQQPTPIERFKAWNRADAFAAPAVALLLIGAFSLLTLADPTFAKDSARAYRWVVIEPVLFYFLLTDAITSRRGVLRIVDFFVAAAVCVALFGLWQFVRDTNTINVEGVSRIVSVYQHPNNLALYLGRVMPLAACFAIFLPWGWRKTLYALATLPLAATLFLTYSRGAWLGVAAAMLVVLVAALRWGRFQEAARPLSSRRVWLAIGAAAMLVVGLVLLALALAPELPTRIFSFGSGSLRVSIWKSSLAMLRDHPIFGVGFDQFLNQFQAHYMPPDMKAESFTAHPHNIFLDYWLSLGIMGLIVLVWLLWRYFREAANAVRHASSRLGADPVGKALSLGLPASMVDFLVHGLVDNSYFLMDLALIFWLSCGLLQVIRQSQAPDNRLPATDN